MHAVLHHPPPEPRPPPHAGIRPIPFCPVHGCNCPVAGKVDLGERGVVWFPSMNTHPQNAAAGAAGQQAEKPRRPPLSFTFRVVIAMALAVLAGLAFQFCGRADLATRFIAPCGTVFLNLIKFIVCPLVLFSVMSGIVSMDSLKKVGILGLKTVAIFLGTTFVAVLVSLLASLAVKGIFPVLGAAGAGAAEPPPALSLGDMLVGVFPSNFAMPFVEANMLQIIVMAIFFAVAIVLAGGEAGRRLAEGVRLLDGLCVKTLEIIMKLSPIGVFCLLCPTVASNGLTVLGSLAEVLLVMYACYAVHLLLVDPLFVALFSGVPSRLFLREMLPAVLFAFSSSSSVGTLPVNMKCVRRLGVPDDIASFVLPLGATINMNGTVIYHGVCAVFVAACYGIDLSIGQLASIAATSTLASVGTAGVPGAGVVMLAMVLSSAGLPLEGIALVAGIDRIFDMGRTVLNITGDAACAVVLSPRRPRA